MGVGTQLNVIVSQENNKIPQSMQNKIQLPLSQKITTDLYAVDPSGNAV
jgi:hypothetical protein